jgi:hypothetical protein
VKPISMRSWLLLSALLVTSISRAHAQDPQALTPTTPVVLLASGVVPRLIKFSGTLLDEHGQPLKSPVGVTFALYSQPTGGGALWLETQNVETDGKGNYRIVGSE